MVVFGGKGLVSMVVQSCVEEMVYWYMIELAGNYKGVHHINYPMSHMSHT